MRTREKTLLSFLPLRKGTSYESPTGGMITRYHGQLKPDGTTTIGIPFERYAVGVGYICVPANMDRKTYIINCMRSGKVGLFTESGDYLWDVPVDKRCLQEIIFPDKNGELGSLIAFINVPKHNTPIVIGIINKDDESQDYEEGKFKLRKESEGALAEVVLDGVSGSATIAVSSEKDNTTAKLNLLIGSRGNEAEVYVRLFGLWNEYIEGQKNTRVTQKITWNVDDPSIDEKKAVWGYEKGVGWSYLDEFNNAWTMKDKQMMIDSVEILHGKDAEEPAVLGDTLESILGDLITAISALTVTTAQGPSGTPINILQFEAVQARFKEFKSKKNKIE